MVIIGQSWNNFPLNIHLNIDETWQWHRKLQTYIEQARAQIIEKMAKLDQVTTKLNCYQHKLEKSKKKLEFWANKLITQQNLLNTKECDLRNQVYTYNTSS
jgi:peptidoglycan hydrolase CwlO-like protein